MTRGPKIVHVSLQRDAFYLVRLYKKCEIYECMHLFAFSLFRVFAHATIFACYFCKRCSHAVFVDSPDPLLHIPITRCVHSLILCVFCFPTVCSLTFHVYHVRYCLMKVQFLLLYPVCQIGVFVAQDRTQGRGVELCSGREVCAVEAKTYMSVMKFSD